MRPVDDELSSVGAYDDVAGVEVAVAELIVLRERVQKDVQIVTRRLVKLGRGDLAVHFVLQFREERYLLREDFYLQVDELFEILRLFIGILVHELLHGLAFDKVENDRPFTVHFGDFVHGGHVEGSSLFHARRIERLVQNV